MQFLGLPLVLLSGLFGWLVAWLIRRNAARLGLVQPANERSSHTVPTPTGGGLGIALGGTLAGLPMLLPLPLAAATALIAGLVIAGIGFADDRKPLSIRLRLGAQALCFGLVVAALPLDGFAYATGLIWPDTILLVLLVLAGVGFINIFNFMDGIDGLAGGEAIFILLGATALIVLANPALLAHPVLWWMLGVAAATLGFLAFNWPPARLFMGDAGSTYLGLMLAVFGFLTISAGWLSGPQWLLLTAAFVADGAATLLRRLWQREPIFQPHRRHAYQQLATRLGRHAPVTLGYLALDLVVLWPLAWLAGQFPAWGTPIALVALAVLIGVAWSLGAGAPLQPISDRK
jgi:Fuc2NAc and GlcNAc transferase